MKLLTILLFLLPTLAHAESHEFEIVPSQTGDRPTGCRFFYSTAPALPFTSVRNVDCDTRFGHEVDRTQNFYYYGRAYNSAGDSPDSAVGEILREELAPEAPTVEHLTSVITPPSVPIQNARLIFEDSFENGSVAVGTWDSNVISENMGSYAAFTRDEAQDGDWSARWVLLNGKRDGTSHQLEFGPNDMQRLTGAREIKEFYAEWYEKFPSDYIFGGGGGGSQKMFRAHMTPENTSEWDFQLDFILLGGCGTPQIHWADRSPTAPGGYYERAANAGVCMVTGRWVKMAVWLKLDDANSLAKIYSDGIEIASIDFTASNSDGMTGFWLGGTRSACPSCSVADKDYQRFIDNFKLYGATN